MTRFSIIRLAPLLLLNPTTKTKTTFLRLANASSLPNNTPSISSKLPSPSPSSSSSPNHHPKLHLIQVQIVHRHGDRTPITPLKNEEFWKSALPHPGILQRISQNIELLRHDEEERVTHGSSGRGPFGQLTTLGLFQMVELGQRLREELVRDPNEEPFVVSSSSSLEEEEQQVIDDHGHPVVKRKLFCPDTSPLEPHRVRVVSTDFPRTVQSVQGVLVGLFPDGVPSTIQIDARHTNSMIPDPQPRRYEEQEELEKKLALRPHLRERERVMKGLAVKVSRILRREMLGMGADEISFGVAEETGADGDEEEKNKEEEGEEEKILPWSQLAEITKCLLDRNLLPSDITPEDQEAISNHAAWRWFENLRHPRLSQLAMYDMVKTMIRNANDAKHCPRKGNEDDAPVLHIFSGHDSSLIGLLCAFRLERPEHWPEYGSYLKMELLASDEPNNNKEYFVRFSLNGELLRSYWGSSSDDDDDDEPMELVPLEQLLDVLEEKDGEEGDEG